MTQRGTFIVNGIERVVVSQLIRSAGAFFTAENIRGRRYYGAKIIPNRGAWIEIETDMNNVVWIKVDRKRKMAATSLLRAFGFQDDEKIMEMFKGVNNHPSIDYIDATIKKDIAKSQDEGLIEVYKRIRPGDLATADNAKSLIFAMFFNFDRYDLGRVGVYKFNTKFDLGYNNDDYDKKENRVLSPEKLLAVLKEVVRLNVTQEEPESVTILITAFLISSSVPKSGIVFPYDFDIFCPSVPGTTAISSITRASGSTGNASPKVLLNFLTTSRAISTCCCWSRPTGTTAAS
jgi:DNA-directed RNA polymerase subunit beta